MRNLGSVIVWALTTVVAFSLAVIIDLVLRHEFGIGAEYARLQSSALAGLLIFPVIFFLPYPLAWARLQSGVQLGWVALVGLLIGAVTWWVLWDYVTSLS